MRPRARQLGWILGVVLALALTSSAFAEPTLDQIKKRGKFLAGVRSDYPPIGYVNKEGKSAGFGVELAKQFAKKLGVEVEFVQTQSKTRIPLLLNGNIDADIGVTTMTREREEVIDFSIVYLWDGGTILVRKGSGIKSIKDLKPPRTASTTQGSLFIDPWKDGTFQRLFKQEMGFEPNFNLWSEHRLQPGI